jgi:hypothetical protein
MVMLFLFKIFTAVVALCSLAMATFVLLCLLPDGDDDGKKDK